jgi:signal transduction histidine kinase
MQRAVSSFGNSEEPLALPSLRTPAKEIRELGEAFLRATESLTAHEKELAEGLANQKRLTREVHHRVKNNLQVVSSLINLHSRGAADNAVVEAYASIQRRVDALAVVHRNHYAELEEHQGVALRALIGEIASNLRASATQEATRTSITLNVMPASATQDIAVPIAFLITEIIELVMVCGPNSNIAIGLSPVPGNPELAKLSIQSPSLATSECLNGPAADRFRRIVTGLARQLRSPLEHDLTLGRYAIDIRVIQP